MPSSVLFATNNEGRVYALSTSSSAWKESYSGMEFKKISAIPSFLWSIGGDRQVYVHVHGMDVPIRVKEESYENERWYPVEGFSKSLLPTDRPKFSNVDGTVDRTIDKIRLPSMAWNWENDWHLDLTFNGQNLDHDGWTYALDFPATFQGKKSWNTCVRRRKWMRFRRYSALNSWCAVAPLHKDPTQEPFMDLSVGGTNVPGAKLGTFVVWSITALGRVMFRSGVSTMCPEGIRWIGINTPSNIEVSKIAVGTTGLVWAILYNGRALVRTGITRDNLTGDSWLEVKPPGSGVKLMDVSIGTSSVWCLTNDKHVWFRRGVRGDASGLSEDSAIGTGWVEMVGNISIISVAQNDQVFALGSEDRAIYYRSGVCESDPTGKKWRLIQLQMQMSRTSSTMSLVSRKSGSSSPGSSSKRKSLSSLFKEKAVVESPAIIENLHDESHHSSPRNRELWKNSYESSHMPNVGSLNDHRRKPNYRLADLHQAYSAPAADIQEIHGRHFETQLKHPGAWSPVRSAGSVVGTEAHAESDSAIFEAENSFRNSGCFGDDDDLLGSQYWAACDVIWTGCSAGALSIDPKNLPNWFNNLVSEDTQTDLTSVWRIETINSFKKRDNSFKHLDLGKYEKAIEMSSWVKNGEARVLKPGGNWEECLIEIEWVCIGFFGNLVK